MRRIPLLASLLLCAFPLSAAKRRAVAKPSGECVYTLSTAAVAAPLASSAATGIVIPVSGSSPLCESFSAWSTVEWIGVETGPGYVALSVEANASNQTRTGIVIIAAQPHEVIQLGTTNLLQNGSFDRDVSSWGWNSFPNSIGTASWSSLDSAGSVQSGSMRIRDSRTGDQAFQRMQCVNAAAGIYEYGFTVRSELRDVTEAVIALVQFEGPDCTGTYPAYSPKAVKVAENGVWESHSWSQRLSSKSQSVMIIVAAYARQAGATQEVWVDEVFLREEP